MWRWGHNMGRGSSDSGRKGDNHKCWAGAGLTREFADANDVAADRMEEGVSSLASMVLNTEQQLMELHSSHLVVGHPLADGNVSQRSILHKQPIARGAWEPAV
eukprot:EG_transcript_46961